MKALVDENLPQRLIPWLRAKGWDAIHVRDIGLGGQSDRRVWDWAHAHSAIIVTQDRDFDARPNDALGARALRLAIGNAPPAVLIAWMEARWDLIVAWADEKAPLMVLP